jgi:hypothetical protein
MALFLVSSSISGCESASKECLRARSSDYYYWFTSDVVVVDNTWVDYVP